MVLLLALHSTTGPPSATVPFNVILLQVGRCSFQIGALRRLPASAGRVGRVVSLYAACRRCCRASEARRGTGVQLGRSQAYRPPSPTVKVCRSPPLPLPLLHRSLARLHAGQPFFTLGASLSDRAVGLRAEQEDARGAAVPAGGCSWSSCAWLFAPLGAAPAAHHFLLHSLWHLHLPRRSWCPPAAAPLPACGTPPAPRTCSSGWMR